MSILALPNELLDHIVSQITYSCDKDGRLQYSRQSNLASLALASKAFVDHARKYLYDRPFLDIRVPKLIWSRALLVVDGLGANGRNVGKIVNSLEGLARWVKLLSTIPNPPKLPYQARDCTAAFSWYLQVLRLCPRTIAVDLAFGNQAELSKILKAINPATSTLRTVSFYKMASIYKDAPSFELLRTALASSELSRIEEIDIESMSLSTPSVATRSPLQLPPTVRHLWIDVYHSDTLGDCLRALPHDLSNLTNLSLATCSTSSSSDFSRILDRLSSDIESLRIGIASFTCPPTLAEYPLATREPSLPFTSFSKFNKLTRLHLEGFVGPSISLLDHLAVACPGLVTIDFEYSTWISERSTTASNTSYSDIVLPADRLIESLGRFEHFEYVDLGYLPTSNEGTYESLKEFMLKRGVGSRWESCRAIGELCSNCGDYHEGELW